MLVEEVHVVSAIRVKRWSAGGGDLGKFCCAGYSRCALIERGGRVYLSVVILVLVVDSLCTLG